LAETFPSETDVIGERMEAAGADPTNAVARHRMLQRILFEGGFAGITWPVEYGGAGLSVDHLVTFNREIHATAIGGEYASSPATFGLTLSMVTPTLLEFASEELKRAHIPAMLRGDELACQFLSEPTGGSDMAGAMTRATRDGDTYVINGSKVWTTSAQHSDFGFLLARTDWDAPKHRGLSMFLVPIPSPGLTIARLRLVTGFDGFCQEFFDDVVIPAANLVGAENDGWTVASRLMVHERNSAGGISGYFNPTLGVPGARRVGGGGATAGLELMELARRRGLAKDALARQLVAEAHTLATVRQHLSDRVSLAARTKVLPPAAGSLLKLFGSSVGERTTDIGMELVGAEAVAWSDPDEHNRSSQGTPYGIVPGSGLTYLFRQAGSILSGTSEIQRNIISERVLGLPREYAPDRDLPFNQVRHN
jgi:alkylation response protein AidB-like acyl-CoA dehydrogenase